MDWYTYALVIGAAIAALLAWNVQRAVIWIVLGALSFILSSAWWDIGAEYPAIFGAITDFLVAGIILGNATKKWEVAVVDCFGFMILVDLFWTVGLIPSHYIYATTLELANWTALIIISMAGILERSTDGRVSARSGFSWLAGVSYRYLYKDTRYPKWWRYP